MPFVVISVYKHGSSGLAHALAHCPFAGSCIMGNEYPDDLGLTGVVLMQNAFTEYKMQKCYNTTASGRNKVVTVVQNDP
jgi:hypothetical protein